MKEKNRIKLICVIITASTSVASAFVGGKKEHITINNNIKSATSDVNNVDDLIKKYEKAMESNSKLAEQNKNLKEENDNLQSDISDSITAEVKSPSIIVDGMKSSQNWNKSIAIVNNSNYYSENLLNSLVEGKFSYDISQNSLFYNEEDQMINKVTKINALSTNVIYEGIGYDVVKSSDGKEILMGSQSYTEGLVVWDDESLFGGGNGYALFDLQGKYSKLEFDVGRTNEYEKENVELKVYLDGECREIYQLDAETPPKHFEVTLNYANSMKLEISGGTRVKYGFVNMILYY